MSNALLTYLDDHLAGSAHALELLEWMKKEHDGSPLGDFFTQLCTEVSRDRETLRNLARGLGSDGDRVKEAVAWTSEKINRLKLHDDGTRPLGTFEALEFLVLGIHGKGALWRALHCVCADDSRLQAFDFKELESRASKQEADVESLRIDFARKAFID